MELVMQLSIDAVAVLLLVQIVRHPRAVLSAAFDAFAVLLTWL